MFGALPMPQPPVVPEVNPALRDPLTQRLFARIAELEETVRQLRAILRQGCTFTPEWDLTAAEEKLLSALYTRPSLTYHQAALAIEREPGGVPKPSGDGYHLVTQYAHRLRRKLERHGIKVTTIRGVGYKLDPENKRKVAAGVVAGTMLQTEKGIAR